MKHILPATVAILAWSAIPCAADFAQIVDARLQNDRLFVTLRHNDMGWHHYADGWDVRLPDGRKIGYRALLHPHIDEQPFTRSLRIQLPQSATALHIRAHDMVHGWGKTFVLLLK